MMARPISGRAGAGGRMRANAFQPRPPGSGTTAERYSFGGTRLRFPITSITIATNTEFAVEWWGAFPDDYDFVDPRFSIAGYWCPTSGTPEQNASSDITMTGISIQMGGTGGWYVCDGATDSGVATLPAGGNVLMPKITGSFRGVYKGRMTFRAPAGTTFPRMSTQSTAAVTSLADGGAVGQERMEGSTTTRFGRLDGTLTGNLSNSGGAFFVPSFVIGKGGDGRPAALLVGDSISFGTSHSNLPAYWTGRQEFGYLATGLDDKTTSKRIPYGHFGIPGQYPIYDVAGSRPNGWANRANWSKKLAAIQQVVAATGVLPFDEVLTQHITNSVPAGSVTLRAGMTAYFQMLKDEFAKPIYVVEGIANSTSTDGYQTVANQTGAVGCVYNSGGANGDLWTYNADVGGPDGLGDPTAYFRAQGLIAGSFAPWRQGSADSGANRDKLSIMNRSYASTVASAYASGTTVTLTDAPSIGDVVNIRKNDGGFFSVLISTVTGAGPYTCTFINLGTIGAASAGNVVRASEHDGAGLHPSPIAHYAVYRPAVIAWKQLRGFV